MEQKTTEDIPLVLLNFVEARIEREKYNAYAQGCRAVAEHLGECISDETIKEFWEKWKTKST